MAVDLTSEAEPLTTAPFGPGLSGWRVLGQRLNPLAPSKPIPTVFDILSRSTGLSQVRQQRAALANDRVDLLLRPAITGLGALDFKGGVRLIETGYQHATEALAQSRLADRFVTWVTQPPAGPVHSAAGRLPMPARGFREEHTIGRTP